MAEFYLFFLILIFGRGGFLRRLCNSEIIFVDGTFKSAPQLFTQIYTLHSYVIGIIIPLIIIIVWVCCLRIFKIIKEAALRNCLVFSPNTFQIDFEIGLIVSIRKTFGYETSIKGCLFHFGQAIWHKVQHLGFIHDFNKNG